MSRMLCSWPSDGEHAWFPVSQWVLVCFIDKGASGCRVGIRRCLSLYSSMRGKYPSNQDNDIKLGTCDNILKKMAIWNHVTS